MAAGSSKGSAILFLVIGAVLIALAATSFTTALGKTVLIFPWENVLDAKSVPQYSQYITAGVGILAIFLGGIRFSRS